MGRRLVHLTSAGSSASPITVCIIFLIVAVIGYFVLERGNNRSDKVKTSSSQTEPSSSTRTSARSTDLADPADTDAATDTDNPPDTPASRASDFPSDYSANDETDYDTEAEESARRRIAQRAENAARLGVKAALKPARSFELSKPEKRKSVGFPDTFAATDMIASFEHYPPSRWHSAKGELEGHTDPERPDSDAPVPHVASRLPLFREGLQTHPTLLAKMEEVEKLLWVNCMDVEEYDGPNTSELESKALSDRWHNRWGKLPEVMFELCRELITSGIIPMVPLAWAMANEPTIANSPAYPAINIIQQGFETAEQTKADGTTGKVFVHKEDADGRAAALDLLLGWFVLSYRGYVQEEWADTSNKSSTARSWAGGAIHAEVADALGGKGSVGEEILKWLGWVGKRYLLSRAVTGQGADLLDGSARLSISRLDANSDALFRLDVTIFVPESQIIQKITTPLSARETAHWSRQSPKSKATGWGSCWLSDAVCRYIHLARPWISHHFPMKGTRVDLDEDRIDLRRLIIRPGFGNGRVNMRSGSMDEPIKPGTSYRDPKTPVLMQLDTEAIDTAADYAEAVKQQGQTKDTLQVLLRRSRITSIRFMNKRQNHWHHPAGDAADEDQFDPTQMAFICGLLIPPLQNHGTDLGDLNLVTGPLSRSGFISLDFGGIVPYIPAEEGDLRVEFVWARLYDRVKRYYIPFMDGGAVTRIISAGAEASGDARKQWNTARWLTDSEGWLLRDLPPKTLSKEMRKLSDAPPHVKRTFVVVLRDFDSDYQNFYRQIGKAIYTDMISITSTSDELGRSKVLKKLKWFIKRLNESVKLTTVTECQTSISDPTLWDLGYALTAAEVLAEQEAMAQGGGREPENHIPPPPSGNAGEVHPQLPNTEDDSDLKAIEEDLARAEREQKRVAAESAALHITAKELLEQERAKNRLPGGPAPQVPGGGIEEEADQEGPPGQSALDSLLLSAMEECIEVDHDTAMSSRQKLLKMVYTDKTSDGHLWNALERLRGLHKRTTEERAVTNSEYAAADTDLRKKAVMDRVFEEAGRREVEANKARKDVKDMLARAGDEEQARLKVMVKRHTEEERQARRERRRNKEPDPAVNELDDGSEAFLNLYYQYQDLRAKNGDERKALRAAGGVVDPCEEHISMSESFAGSKIPRDVLIAACTLPLWDKRGSDCRMMLRHRQWKVQDISEHDILRDIQDTVKNMKEYSDHADPTDPIWHRTIALELRDQLDRKLGKEHRNRVEIMEAFRAEATAAFRNAKAGREEQQRASVQSVSDEESEENAEEKERRLACPVSPL